MKVKSLSELPETGHCLKCDRDKPIAEMIVVRLRSRCLIYLRPRCKKCHNKFEKGRRREWKTKYLRGWRFRNAELNEAYWRKDHDQNRLAINARAYNRFVANHDALLIQGRLRRALDMHVSLAEAKKLAKTYGRCFPTRFGLTSSGLRECERIRSRARAAVRAGKQTKMPHPVEIRMMVYAEKGFVIKPRLQKQPYQRVANQLRQWHTQQRSEKAA